MKLIEPGLASVNTLPTMHCNGAIAFAEGAMEREHFRRSFRKMTTIPVANGDSVTLARMTDEIVSKLRVRGSKPTHIFVIVDRENRTETAAEIDIFVRAAIIAEGYNDSDISMLVSDRMIENVILADESYIRTVFAMPDYTYEHVSLKGKAVLKSLYKAQGVNYKETVQGIIALNSIDLGLAANKCDSVRRFLNSLPFGCYLRPAET